MKPVKAVKNQYVGINAHLHSYWQGDGDWSEFHTSYIVQLSRTLKTQLLPLGYTTGIEQSLQIRRNDRQVQRPTSDVTIYAQDPPTVREAAVTYMGRTEQLTLTLSDVFREEDDISEKPYHTLGFMKASKNANAVSLSPGLKYSHHQINQGDVMPKHTATNVVHSLNTAWCWLKLIIFMNPHRHSKIFPIIAHVRVDQKRSRVLMPIVLLLSIHARDLTEEKCRSINLTQIRRYQRLQFHYRA